MSECPTRFSLIQYKAGELCEKASHDVAAHVRKCPDCADIIRRFEEKDARCQELREQHLGQIHNAYRAPLSLGLPQRRTWFGHPLLYPALGGLAAALAVVLGVIYLTVGFNSVKSDTSRSEIRYKGDAVLEVFATRHGNRFAVEEDSALQAGDVLEIGATLSQSGYVAFFALHPLPISATDLTRETDYKDSDLAGEVASSGYYQLQRGISLTNEMHGEIYLLIFSKDPFSKKQAEQRAMQLMKDQRITGSPFGMLEMAPLHGVFFKVEISNRLYDGRDS